MDSPFRVETILFRYNPGVKKSSPGSATFEDFRRAALALPDVEEGTAYGFPAFRKGATLFLCFRTDLDSMAMASSFEQRDAMIAEDPETYYTTDHHRPYPWVLARMSKLHTTVVRDLVQMGWRSAQKKPAKRRARAR
jgi:hypothetical protein